RADHCVHTFVCYRKLLSGPHADINVQAKFETQFSQITVHKRVGFDANPPNADGEINQIHSGSWTNFQHVPVDPGKQSLLLPRNAQLISSIEPRLNQGLGPLPTTQPCTATHQ